MDDYEINRRLAEIAGEMVWRTTFADNRQGLGYPGTPKRPIREWSPLTDWSQLGPLMEAHVLDIERYATDPQEWCVWAMRGGKEGTKPGYAHIDLRRAICRAIIAAHEEEEA